MTVSKSEFTAGAFVFTRAYGMQPTTEDHAKALAVKHGIDEGLVPKYAGDRTAVSRAVEAVKPGLGRQGFWLEPIVSTDEELVVGIVRKNVNKKDLDLKPDYEAALRWRAEKPEAVEGEHEVAKRVAEKYSELRGKVVAEDWTKSVVSFIESAGAARVRNDGRVYWCPPQAMENIEKFGALISEVGIDLVVCRVMPEQVPVVKAVAQDSLAEQLTKLQEEVSSFDGKQKPSTYASRLEQYQSLKERAILYRDGLGLGVEQTVSALKELEVKVQSMLDVRSKVVFHRSPKGEVVSTPKEPEVPAEMKAAAASPSSVKLSFGGASFEQQDVEADGTMVFTSGEQAAKDVVVRMAAMGMAGKNLVAGKVTAVVQNNGPVGTEVSIKLTMAGGNLMTNATSLAQLGITWRN